MATINVSSVTHASRHIAGGPDALPWSSIHGSGTQAQRPAASSANANYFYTQTDSASPGAGLYQQLGGTWTLLATVGSTVAGATSTTPGVIQLAGDLAGSSSAPKVAAINGTTVPASSAAGTYLTTTAAGTAQWNPLSFVDNGNGTATITY